MVSDGSYFPDEEAGGVAFIISAEKNGHNLIGLNWSPGTKEDQNPYRSELVGIKDGLSALAIIIIFFKLKKVG